MTKNHKIWLLIFLFFSFSFYAFCVDSKGWVVGAQKFEYSGISTKSDSALNDGIAKMFPSRILEKIGQNAIHVTYPEEKLEQTKYNLRKDRISLFVQLSAAYKKRDALILNAYSSRKLRRKIKEEEKNITAIQEKIAKNLNDQWIAEQKEIKERELVALGKYYDDNYLEEIKMSSMVKNLFSKNSEIVTTSNIVFYKNDVSELFNPSDSIKNSEKNSYAYEKEVVSANINTLITGYILSYGDYMSVTVEAYAYPGGKKLCAVTEVGSVDEADMISTSLARQILPVITNSMPVVVNFSVEPDNKVSLYIDDVLQKKIPENFILDSGVHTLLFSADGYKTVSTSYYFGGNKDYSIEVQLEPVSEGYMLLENLKPVPGNVFANGKMLPTEENVSVLKINGSNILGMFISEDGFTSNYYIPEKMVYNGSELTFAPKLFDKNAYIDKRRKYMYGSYSLLMLSLIPTFYTYGKYYNTAQFYNVRYENLEEALKWEKANQICTGISIGCGVLFTFELVRYFKAANSVLPEKVKVKKASKKTKLSEDFAKKEADSNQENQNNDILDDAIDIETIE